MFNSINVFSKVAVFETVFISVIRLNQGNRFKMFSAAAA